MRIKTIFLSSNTEASSIDYSGQVAIPSIQLPYLNTKMTYYYFSELVASNRNEKGELEPLCSDAFTKWQINDPRRILNNTDVLNASQR